MGRTLFEELPGGGDLLRVAVVGATLAVGFNDDVYRDVFGVG